MEDQCNAEIGHDEFECAECDYKAGTETEMMDHSEMHRGEEDDMVDSTSKDNYTPGKNINKTIQNEPVLGSIKSECDSSRGIKRELDLFQTNFPNKDQSKQKCENKKIKLDEIEIDNNHVSFFSSDKIINNETIKEERDPLETERLDFNDQSQKLKNNDPMRIKDVIPGVVAEVDNTGKYIPEGWERKVYRLTKGTHIGCYRAIYIAPNGKLLSNKNEVSNHIKYLQNLGIRSSVQIQQLDFTSSQIKKTREYKTKTQRVEIEVDNSNVYIPDGWKRKAFEYLSPMYKVIVYISPFNKEIKERKRMRQYLDQLESEGHNISVDIERLNFSLKTLMIEKKEQKIQGEDIDIDNTGKYIPDGWQRKVFRRTYGPGKGCHGTYYISSTGTKLYSKREALAHIKLTEKLGIKSPIDVEQLDFTTASHNLPKTKERKKIEKVEIELDNTNVYIPEGWKRKYFKYISGDGKECRGGILHIPV